MSSVLALLAPKGLTRWHATSASVFLEANAGLQYVFGDVSGSLRSRLGYTQRQIDGLGTAKVCPPRTRGVGIRRSTSQRDAATAFRNLHRSVTYFRLSFSVSRCLSQDCGTALVDVMAGFMFDNLGAPATLIFIAVRRALKQPESRGLATQPLVPDAQLFGLLRATAGVHRRGADELLLHGACPRAGCGRLLTPRRCSSPPWALAATALCCCRAW